MYLFHVLLVVVPFTSLSRFGVGCGNMEAPFIFRCWGAATVGFTVDVRSGRYAGVALARRFIPRLIPCPIGQGSTFAFWAFALLNRSEFALSPRWGMGLICNGLRNAGRSVHPILEFNACFGWSMGAIGLGISHFSEYFQTTGVREKLALAVAGHVFRNSQGMRRAVHDLFPMLFVKQLQSVQSSLDQSCDGFMSTTSY